MFLFLGLNHLTQNDYFQSVHLPVHFVILFSLIVRFCVNMQHFIIHSLVYRQLGYFNVVAIVSKSLLSVGESISLQEDMKFFECIPKSDMVRSCGRFISSFVMNLQNVFIVGAPFCNPTISGLITLFPHMISHHLIYKILAIIICII